MTIRIQTRKREADHTPATDRHTGGEKDSVLGRIRNIGYGWQQGPVWVWRTCDRQRTKLAGRVLVGGVMSPAMCLLHRPWWSLWGSQVLLVALSWGDAMAYNFCAYLRRVLEMIREANMRSTYPRGCGRSSTWVEPDLVICCAICIWCPPSPAQLPFLSFVSYLKVSLVPDIH